MLNRYLSILPTLLPNICITSISTTAPEFPTADRPQALQPLGTLHHHHRAFNASTQHHHRHLTLEESRSLGAGAQQGCGSSGATHMTKSMKKRALWRR